MSAANRAIVAILVVVGLAVAFWMLALSPKREKADELSKQVDSLGLSLAQAQSRVSEGLEAKEQFPDDYRQLVVLGQAVPQGDETSTLLVELGKEAERAKVEFESLTLTGGGEASSSESAAATPSGESSSAVPASTVPPTEAAASLLPLGASVGSAGLGVMPYNLSFSGDFFQIADFIAGIDSLVGTKDEQVTVDGRLMTIDGFALNPNGAVLDATFNVTTYVIPPGEGLTAGASPTEPAPASSEAETSEGAAASETVAR